MNINFDTWMSSVGTGVGAPTVLELGGKKYLKRVLEHAIENIQDRIKNNLEFGTVSRPDDLHSLPSHISPISASHLVSKLEINDGVVDIEVTILDTPMGIILKEMHGAGCQIKYLPCGVGKINEEGIITEYEITSITAVVD